MKKFPGQRIYLELVKLLNWYKIRYQHITI